MFAKCVSHWKKTIFSIKFQNVLERCKNVPKLTINILKIWPDWQQNYFSNTFQQIAEMLPDCINFVFSSGCQIVAILVILNNRFKRLFLLI